MWDWSLQTAAPSRPAAIGILAVGALLMSGCTAIQAQSRVDPQTIAHYGRSNATPPNADCPAQLPEDSHGGAINLDCFHFPGDEDETAYVRAAATGDDAELYRNRLAAVLLKHADDVCTLEMGRLVADEAFVNTTLSTLTSGLAGASTIVTGNLAKSILSGGADFTNAFRSHINEHVYRNVLATAVGRAIRNDQEKRRGEIASRLKEPAKDYNVDAMIVDVNAYHQVCSLERGLGLVIDAVDRSRFEAGEVFSGISLAIQMLDTRISALEAEFAKAANDKDKESILAELTAYRQQRQDLVKKLTGVVPSLGAPAKPPDTKDEGAHSSPQNGNKGDAGATAAKPSGSNPGH
jgi:hypothetical protein